MNLITPAKTHPLERETRKAAKRNGRRGRTVPGAEQEGQRDSTKGGWRVEGSKEKEGETRRDTEREESVEKQSVAKRREPSWRVAATNGLMNLMEASRHRVAGELRTENKRDRARRKRVPSETVRKLQARQRG